MNDLAKATHPLLGHRWALAGQPITVADVALSLHHLGCILEGLDLVVIDEETWHPGSSARTLLPTATSLAHLWSQHPADTTTG